MTAFRGAVVTGAAGGAYCRGMRYPDGGGLSAAGRARREKVRLQAAAKRREEKLSTVKRDLGQLRPRLATLAGQDERADACMRALPGTQPARWAVMMERSRR